CLYCCVLLTTLLFFVLLFFFFFLMLPPPPISTLFPYTTLFRSLLHRAGHRLHADHQRPAAGAVPVPCLHGHQAGHRRLCRQQPPDRKSTRLNSSHSQISYAVFCLKKKKKRKKIIII